MIANILIAAGFLVCGFLCGMMFDSYMWLKAYKNRKKAALMLLEEYSHEI